MAQLVHAHKKKIIRAFKFLGFKIEVSSNNKIVNFLDVTLNLSNNTYKPFMKTDQYPSYVNVNSNHPKTIIKQVPKTVNLRIRNLSANEKIFQESSKIYIWMPLKIAVLGKSLPTKKKIYLMILIKKIRSMVKKNRKRKIIWFNPPFCRLASINVGKYFLKLIDKHFKHDNILHKISNRKTLKISYTCTKNIFQIINNHNKEIIKEFHDRTNNNNNNNNNSKQNVIVKLE